MKKKTYSLSEEAIKTLEEMAEKTKLKMSTIIECGIYKMQEFYNEQRNARV